MSEVKLPPPYNRETFLNNFIGLEDIALETIQIFIKSLPKMVSDVEAAIQSKNSSDLEHSAHTLKGAISNFYAEPSRLLAWELEQKGHKGELKSVEQVFKKLKVELNRLIPALNELIAEKRS